MLDDIPSTTHIATKNSVILAGEIRTVGDLLKEGHERFDVPLGIAAGVAFGAESQMSAIRAAAWLAASGRAGLITTLERLTSPTKESLLAEGMLLASADSADVWGKPGLALPYPGIRILTSGTTGVPKLVRHSWQSLYTGVAVRNPKPLRWLVTFQVGTYAWYQIVAPFLFRPGTELVASAEFSVPEMVHAAECGQVTAISSTPTFWRLAFLQCAESVLLRIPLQQISLGGEPVDQAILDSLDRLYPSASITHIFASTESGPAIVVSDRKAGFPAAWIDLESEARGIRLNSGSLEVRTRWAASEAAEWVSTGDRVEMRGDRAFIVGRDGRTEINVGGLKVSTFDVEKVLLRCPGVLWCRVSAVKAPLVGQLVGADIVGGPDSGPATALVQAVSLFCGESLPDHMVPRFIRVLDKVPVGQNLKSEVARG